MGEIVLLLATCDWGVYIFFIFSKAVGVVHIKGSWVLCTWIEIISNGNGSWMCNGFVISHEFLIGNFDWILYTLLNLVSIE